MRGPLKKATESTLLIVFKGLILWFLLSPEIHEVLNLKLLINILELSRKIFLYK
jgi:hypothetical protein